MWLKFVNPLRGLLRAFKQDRNIRFTIILGTVVIGSTHFFSGPLAPLEVILLGLAWASALVTEVQNSAFETTLDKLHPEHADEIGYGKDLAAGAVVLAGTAALIVSAVVFFDLLL